MAFHSSAFLALILLVTTVSSSQAANIYYSEPKSIEGWGILGSQIRIEGKIEKGDFDKFYDLVLKKKNNDTVFITSSGGDVLEAIKIAGFIRRAYIQVSLTGYCNSACFIIYASAMRRANNGESFALHRPFYEKESYKALSPSEAQEAYINLEKVFRDHLLQNRVPLYLVDKLMRFNSNDAWVVSGYDMDRIIGQTDAAYEELLLAKCGSKTKSETNDSKKIPQLEPGSTCKEVDSQLRLLGMSVGYCDYLMARGHEIYQCASSITTKARNDYLVTFKKLHKQ